jgi:phosphopantothenoylcysteine decarboxylase/phosphopantothenate--cysteine ligase
MPPAKPRRKVPQNTTPSLSGRKVLLAVTGGVACYKSAALTSLLVQAGAQVRVIMTDAATKFVAPLTFQSLSGNAVLSSVWQSDDRPDSQHVGLARWCHIMVIAPATADIIARLAAGLTDDLVSLTALALPRSPTPTPLLLAPAMNADMWASPILQRNLETLTDTLGCTTVGPESGWQACRTTGQGRMSQPQTILDAAANRLPVK